MARNLSEALGLLGSIAVLTVAWLACSSVPALAQTDELIPGKLVIVKPAKLAKFLAKPPRGSVFSLPSGADPTVGGASLRVFDTTSPGGGDDTYQLPAAGWTGLGNPPGVRGFKYRGAGTAEDPCRIVLFKDREIKAVCKKDGVNLVPPFAGEAGVVLTTGADSNRYCASFGGTEVKNTEKGLERRNAPAPDACPAATPQEAEVIVVGAGISGLVSALSLARQGVDVILLEKEQQVGGRMYSVSLGGVACNLGAQYLYSGGHPLIDSYMEELPLQTVDVAAMVWDGQYVGTGTELELLFKLPISQEAKVDVINAFLQMSVDYGEISKDRDFFFDIEPESSSWMTLDGESCQDYLSGYSPDVYKFINGELGPEAGGEIADLSALLMVGWYGVPELEIARALTQGGNRGLPERMKDDFLEAGGRLEFNSEVTAVVQNGDAVNVTCRDGREFTSAHAIVATPVDAAMYIVRDLPASKKEALEAVEYGSIAIVCMHLTGLPAGDELAGGLYIGESDIDGYINQTGDVLGNPDTGTVISVILTDEAMLQRDDQAMVQRIVEALQVVNPDLDAETDILEYEVQRWPRGIVKYYPGFLTQYESALREPVGRIYFAGDYAHDPAIGGAAWSGERAASAVLSAMGK